MDTWQELQNEINWKQKLQKLGSYQYACLKEVERHGVVYANQCNARERKAYGRLVQLGIHGWFVSSNGFNIVELNTNEREEAEKEAVFLCHQRAETFDKCAHVVIEIGETEMLKVPRKLTIRERLTGMTNP